MLLDQYVEEIWRAPGISTSTVGYGDAKRRRVFANSEGSYVDQTVLDVVMRLNAVARDGADVQQSGVSLGSAGDFSEIEGLHDEAAQVGRRAVELLKAPRSKAASTPLCSEPVLAGVFIHEAFGHLSEADHVYEDDRMKEIMVLGKRFGGQHLNVVDGAAVPDLRGSYGYDDEGVPSTRSYLLQEGVLVGRLHSRETAAKMGEAPTGNARAIGPQFPPIVRMTNTFIEGGDASPEEIIGDVKDGLVRGQLVRRHDQHGAVHLLRRRGLGHPKRKGGGALPPGAPYRQPLHHPGEPRRRRQRPEHEPGRRLRQGGPVTPARVQRQPPHPHSEVPNWRKLTEMLQQVLERGQGRIRAGGGLSPFRLEPPCGL